MIRPSTDLPLGADPASRFLPWTVGFLVFLATLSLAVGMLMVSANGNWRHNLLGTLTIQVPVGPDKQEASSAVIEVLRAIPDIQEAKRVSDSEIATLLEPWLGAQASILDLPVPILIDATVADGRTIDIETLGARLSAVAPGTTVDDHAVWLKHLMDLADITGAVSLSVMVFVLISMLMTVVFTTRTGLAIHGEVVEVLHIIGAQDSYIARQFQVHTFWLSGIGAAVGFTLSTGVIVLLQFYGDRLTEGLLPDLALGGVGWGALCALPVAAVSLVFLTAGITVKRLLGRMM